MWGQHCLKAWSETQAIITLSNGEAELGAIVKAFAEAPGMRSVYTLVVELHLPIQAEVSEVGPVCPRRHLHWQGPGAVH